MPKTVYYIIGERADQPAHLLFTWTGSPEAGVALAEQEAARWGSTFDRIVAERIQPDNVAERTPCARCGGDGVVAERYCDCPAGRERADTDKAEREALHRKLRL